jgi:hypothetical protein
MLLKSDHFFGAAPIKRYIKEAPEGDAWGFEENGPLNGVLQTHEI